MSFLTGKKIVVMGVANKKSIAWGCAQALIQQGAEVIYTYQNERMAKSLVKGRLNGLIISDITLNHERLLSN